MIMLRKGKINKNDENKQTDNSTMIYPSISNVVDSFESFLNSYEEWRSMVGLSGKIDNAFEMTTALSDKNGRICRYVKHQERNDPKSDWPDGMASEMVGYIIYLIMLMKYYNIDLPKGIKFELLKSVKQHASEKQQ